MRGQEGSRQQSVHADGVVEAGNEVLKLMQTQLRHRGLQSWNEVSKDVGHSSKGRADRFDIRRGLEHLSGLMLHMKMHVFHLRQPLAQISKELDENDRFKNEGTIKMLRAQIEAYKAF